MSLDFSDVEISRDGTNTVTAGGVVLRFARCRRWRVALVASAFFALFAMARKSGFSDSGVMDAVALVIIAPLTTARRQRDRGTCPHRARTPATRPSTYAG
jgi:hypothetical protein